MNDEFNANRESPAHFANGRMHDRQRSQGRSAKGFSRNGREPDPRFQQNAPSQFSAADAMPFLDALGRRWAWLLIGGMALAAVGLSGGLLLWKNSYTASVQLLRQESVHSTEVLGERELASDTYASLLRAPELLQRVAAQARPPLPPEALSKRLNITPERSSDVILVAISTDDAQAAVNLANLYAQEAVRFTRDLQTNAAVEVSRFVSQQLTPIEDEISALNKIPQMVPIRQRAVMAPSAPSLLNEKLTTARGELTDLLARYTDQHPLVREQRAKIAAIESQLMRTPATPMVAEASGDTNTDASLTQERDPAFIHTKLQSLENARLTLVGQRQAALSLQTHPPGTCQVLAPAALKEVIPHTRTAKVAVITTFGGLLGVLMAMAMVLVGEAMDTRLKTVADVKRVTRLPVIASAGDLGRMTEGEQKNWAFRTWTSLQSVLSSSSNQGFVCGITSSEAGEGRSTWVRLLADAASQRGFRVLTIVARPPESPAESNGKVLIENAPVANGKSASEAVLPVNGNSALVGINVLSTPAEVTQKLIGPNPEPVVQIPLPGWVWNLERRKQWQSALRHWSQIDNIALLIELPPASLPETVLLAENLPNLIWLSDSQKATAVKTCEQLETLRNARCHLAGAVVNRAPVSFLKNRFARWFGCMMLLAGLPALSAYSQDSGNQATNELSGPANTNFSFSVVTPAQRAAWQQRLTLGPGDVVSIALWGEPALTHMEVAVGPDGRINFAEAQDVLASGLTVDELRAKMNEELGKYRRAPQTMITPVAFRSKKYYMLGRVMMKGVYILDRPTTVLEAVARAHGFETGLVDRNIIDVADFSRSFLMRRGSRIPLNFEKLFQSGDLSQNLSIEPGDYIFFPGSNVKEVYVLGEVRLPGPAAYTPNLTLMAAISARAGYTDRAWKGKVLVVRGSLNKPETFAIETKDILAGKTRDFRLQPKDIVFVNSRPFIYGEELADLAITAFLQSLVTAEVGNDLIKPFQGSE